MFLLIIVSSRYVSTKWVTGALGVENGLISGIMGNVGSKKSDVKSYSVTENGDGTLTIA